MWKSQLAERTCKMLTGAQKGKPKDTSVEYFIVKLKLQILNLNLFSKFQFKI